MKQRQKRFNIILVLSCSYVIIQNITKLAAGSELWQPLPCKLCLSLSIGLLHDILLLEGAVQGRVQLGSVDGVAEDVGECLFVHRQKSGQVGGLPQQTVDVLGRHTRQFAHEVLECEKKVGSDCTTTNHEHYLLHI